MSAEIKSDRSITGQRGSLKRYLLWGIVFWGGLASAVYIALIMWIADLPTWLAIIVPILCFALAGLIWGVVAWLIRPRRLRRTNPVP